jgi:glycine C-acetyltransferase
MSQPAPLAYLRAQLDEIRAAGAYQRLRELEGPCEPISRYDGREVINLASNNYLGLANHPKLKEAAIAATREFGVGSGAVRTISGTMAMHMELERRIAGFKNVEACVVFQSGFTANAGTVPAVLGKDDHIISNKLNHASIIDGCRLSRAKIHVFRHADAGDAEGETGGARRRGRPQAADHRRGVFDGWRHRPAAGAGRVGRPPRRHHDGG